MKKLLSYSIIICFILIFVKYRYSDYDIKYEIGDYKIRTSYSDKRLYYEITDGNKTYNFDVYMRRSLSKKNITNIKTIEGDNFNCIYPVVKDIETYPLCYIGDEFTDYNLIDSELLESYKKETINIEKSEKDFIYYNNLDNSEYIALWNYKGYIVMNGKTYNNIDLFKKDKYDNTLSYLIKDTLYIADYDQEHEYNKLITLNLKTLKKSEIILNKKIDFDSYFVGHINKKLYIYDNKNSILYEIDIRNGETEIKGNNEIGFVKYNNGKFIVCSKSEYKINKIKYDINESIYIYTNNNGLFKTIKENSKLIQKITNDDVKLIKENNNKIYYLDVDSFYMYTPNNGNELIFYNYELSFNNENTIFVYLNN
ncbi:MAG: hypothetical protein ACI33S_06840 [Bacilli bacterium]